MHAAEDFTLADQNGIDHRLSDYRGKWVILYFYPKDHTPGCTAEACSFRDANESLLARDAVVLGVSADSVQSHAAFTKDYELPFTLLSDPGLTTIKDYGALGKKMFGKEGILRKTFIIDPNGNVVKVYGRVTPAEHATRIAQELAQLQQSPK